MGGALLPAKSPFVNRVTSSSLVGAVDPTIYFPARINGISMASCTGAITSCATWIATMFSRKASATAAQMNPVINGVGMTPMVRPAAILRVKVIGSAPFFSWSVRGPMILRCT